MTTTKLNTALLAKTKFALAQDTPAQRIICATSGREKRGKNHFAFTAPGPIGVFNLDQGLEGVVEKFRRGEVPGFPKKDIFVSQYRVPARHSMDRDKIKNTAQREWDRFIDEWEQAFKVGFRTVVVDTATELWQLWQMSQFGKTDQIPQHLYGPLNSTFRDVVRMAYDYSANVIFLQKVKKQYEARPGAKDGSWNGLYEPAGFQDMGYNVQVNLRHDRDSDGNFSTTIVDCRAAAHLNDFPLEGDDNCFAGLATYIFTDTTREDWL